MRILIVSSQFHTGGYGQYCHEASQQLADRGHDLCILTCRDEGCESGHGSRVLPLLWRDPDWKSRWPGYAQFFLGRKQKEGDNLQVFKNAFQHFQPDVIFVWQGMGLPRSMLAAAERSGCPVVYRLCDYWPGVPDEYWAYWQKPASQLPHKWIKRAFAPLALAMLRGEGKPLVLEFKHAVCVSDAVGHRLIQSGVRFGDVVTIFNGIDLKDFEVDPSSLPWPRRGPGTLTLLYGGQLVHHKGVHVAIEAMRYLCDGAPNTDIALTIIGDGPEAYVSHLRRLTHDLNLEAKVRFLAARPRNEMRDLLRGYDVLVFPSLYEEPLARMMQEAMAAGLVVVSTATGGSAEILVDDVNSLVFEVGNPSALAAQIERLTDTSLRQRLALAAQQTVREKCDMEQAVLQLEAHLQQVVLSHGSGRNVQ